MNKHITSGFLGMGVALAAALVGGGCAHHAPEAADSARLPAEGAPAAGQIDLTDRATSAFDRQPLPELKLYPHEHWKVSREFEMDEFAKHVRSILKAQAYLARKKRQDPSRVFHKKQTGCLIGQLVPVDDRRDGGATKRGMFARDSQHPYMVMARFSNGVGFSESDALPDVRGIAIKVFGVRDDATGEEKPVDFLMTNSPTAFGRDEQEFIEFAEAQVYKGNVGFGEFAIKHAETAKRILAASKGGSPLAIASVMDLQYWAGHPYLLSAEGPAVKLNVLPFYDDRVAAERGDRRWRESHKLSPGYFSEELARRMKRSPMRFGLQLQIEHDEATTPIEDGLHEWREADAPSIQVARLQFDRQDINDPELQNLCAQARFSPGHFVTQHRPLGNLGRGRVLAYRASQIGRGAPAEATSEAKVLEVLKRVALPAAE